VVIACAAQRQPLSGPGDLLAHVGTPNSAALAQLVAMGR
jgi:hypothetical protein